MRNKFFFIILLFGFAARADIMTSVGQIHDFEKTAAAGQFVDRVPFAVRLGYREFEKALFVEYNQFSSSDAFSQILITRTRHEILLWGRHSFWSEKMIQCYLQAAPGIQIEHVQTNFFLETQNDTSKPALALAAAAGTALEIKHFRLEVELKALTSAMSTPNPTLGIGVYGGYLF